MLSYFIMLIPNPDYGKFCKGTLYCVFTSVLLRNRCGSHRKFILIMHRRQTFLPGQIPDNPLFSLIYVCFYV